MRWLLGILAGFALAGVITWAVIAQNRWDDRCHQAGGTVESRFEGFMTIYINGHPYLQPQYSSHCWVNGREVQP
jgi:hypothetical protein